MELLQLHDLQPSEHAAAEKQDMAHDAMLPKAGRAMQLNIVPIVICCLDVVCGFDVEQGKGQSGEKAKKAQVTRPNRT